MAVLGDYAAIMEAQEITHGQAMFALDFIGDTVFACHLGVEAMRATDDSGLTGLDRVRTALGERETRGMRPQESWKERGMSDIKVRFIIFGLEYHWPSV